MIQETRTPQTRTPQTPKLENQHKNMRKSSGKDKSSRKAALLWDDCAKNIRNQLSDTAWNTTFNNTKALELQQDLLTLQVPTVLHKMRIERKYFPLLKNAVEEASSHDISVMLTIDSSTENSIATHPSTPHSSRAHHNASQPQHSTTQHNTAQHAMSYERDNGVQHSSTATRSNEHNEHIAKRSGKRQNASSPDGCKIKPQLTFEQFVIGSSNRFAHAAAVAVAENPANDYNPLFIHSDSGMGKTHLLYAIANYTTRNYPTYRTRYITSEKFVNDFIRSIRHNTQSEFRQMYRHDDLLLIDDIQFLQDKTGLQEEFFHTFNEVFQNGGQVVLSSDRQPDAMPGLENRLRSRFKSGLITDIQLPDHVTRLAILQKKLETKKVQVLDSVLNYIAENVANSIRELEGALIKILAHSQMNNEICEIDMAKHLLSSLVSSKAKEPITVDLIIDTTSMVYGFTREQITGGSRVRNLVQARQVAMYTARNLTSFSYPEIGKHFGGRDHTTVIHAYNKIKKQISYDRDLFENTQRLQGALEHART